MAQVFSCEFWEISNSTFFTEHLWTAASDRKTLMSEACNIIKEENLEQVLSCKFCEIFKSTFFVQHLFIMIQALILWYELTQFQAGHFAWKVCNYEDYCAHLDPGYFTKCLFTLIPEKFFVGILKK